MAFGKLSIPAKLTKDSKQLIFIEKLSISSYFIIILANI